jgi:ribosome-associated translation inhibitor RaiA
MQLSIRNQGLEVDPGLRDAIERRLLFILARYCSRIGRINVKLAGLDGACGELRIQCHIVIRLVPFGQVTVDVAAVDLDSALDWAAKRIGPAVNRELMRWRDRRGKLRI